MDWSVDRWRLARQGLELREEQLKNSVIRLGSLRGSIEPLEQEMLDGVLAFGELNVNIIILLTPV